MFLFQFLSAVQVNENYTNSSRFLFSTAAWLNILSIQFQYFFYFVLYTAGLIERRALDRREAVEF